MEWTGAKHKGHGRFYASGVGRDSIVQARRWIFEQFYGSIPEGSQVDHPADGQIKDFAGRLHRDVEGARNHVRVQLDVRCACGLWFHSAARFKIIATMLGGTPAIERLGREHL